MSATQVPAEDPGAALRALARTDFGWTTILAGIWRTQPFDLPDLNRHVADAVVDDLNRLKGTFTPDLPGRLIVGTAGSGKTHLLSQVRHRTWDAGCWFVLLDIVGIKDFWKTAALGIVSSLLQPMPDGRLQVEHVLRAFLATFPVQEIGHDPLDRILGDDVQASLASTELMLRALARTDRLAVLNYGDVIRALFLLNSFDLDVSGRAHAWLQGHDTSEEERTAMGIRRPPPPMPEIVRGLCWVMGTAGPSVIALDQLDSLVTASNLAGGMEEEPRSEEERMARVIIENLAGGLLDLYDLKHRAVLLLSCLERTWDILSKRVSVRSFPQRFGRPLILEPLRAHNLIEGLIASRLAPAFRAEGLTPIHPTWPFTQEALDSATGMYPRSILMKCDEYRLRCIAEGKVVPCTAIGTPVPVAANAKTANPAAPTGPVPGPTNILDAAFERKRSAVDVLALTVPAAEDGPMRVFMEDAVRLFAMENPLRETADWQLQKAGKAAKPALHARMTLVDHADGDRETYWCFRAVTQTNAVAFQSRMSAAITAAGIDRDIGFRKLVVVRHGPPPSGAKSNALWKTFLDAGGVHAELNQEDLRTIKALAEMRDERTEGFEPWLRAKGLVRQTALFTKAGLNPPPFRAEGDPVVAAAVPHAPAPSQVPAREAGQKLKAAPVTKAPAVQVPTPKPAKAVSTGGVYVGMKEGAALRQGEVRLPTSILPRHTAILAGSGSGKTVLLRRIVEEAALQGLPAIVLDSNNDLARLGTPWPQRPPVFTDADQAQAETYAARVECVVWTPGRADGRPISLPLLPDFASVREDPVERDQAVQLALATMAPLLNATGVQGQIRRGVLSNALKRVAGTGGKVEDLVALLQDLPDGVTNINNAAKLAAEMADRLIAHLDTDPSMQGGAVVEVGTLFQATDPAKVRISVINFSGIPGDEQRQSFVNSLQMALFTWIKANPSPTGRLMAMDEAQNFAPSKEDTPCRASTLSLAAQARKYGLGMVFATQTPKGIDNKIVSNCVTHFYGKMNAPATIQATQELIAAKGGRDVRIAGLGAGQFYLSTEGAEKPFQIRTPLCLTWHPANPMSSDEVIDLARRNSG